jgi:hypothetical protein
MAFCHQLGGYYAGKQGCAFKHYTICAPTDGACIYQYAFNPYTGANYEYVSLTEIFTEKFSQNYTTSISVSNQPSSSLTNFKFF